MSREHTRATSQYKLLVFGATTDMLVSALRYTGRNANDRYVGEENGQPFAAIGFRAADDDEATRVATSTVVAGGYEFKPARLITGYGVHRRTVATS